MSHAIKPIDIVADYFGTRDAPVISQAFKPGTGWKTYPFRKRISGSWARKMRDDGYTVVALSDGTRLADFGLDEIIKDSNKPLLTRDPREIALRRRVDALPA